MADALQVITLKVTQLSSEIQDANTRSITATSKVSEQATVIAQLERTVSHKFDVKECTAATQIICSYFTT